MNSWYRYIINYAISGIKPMNTCSTAKMAPLDSIFNKSIVAIVFIINCWKNGLVTTSNCKQLPCTAPITYKLFV